MERSSVSPRTILIAFLLSFVAAFGVALFIYSRFVAYEPLAARHMPEKVLMAVRVDVQQAVVFEPFRLHLLGLLERGRGQAQREPRVKNLERKTTLELAVDAREMVYAVLPEGEWLLVAGGMFRQDGVIDGVVRLFGEEGVLLQERNGLAVHASGISFGVAEGGILLLGSKEAIVHEAQTASEVSWAKKLDQKGLGLHALSWARPSTILKRAALRLAVGEPFQSQGELFFSNEGQDDGNELQKAGDMMKKAFPFVKPEAFKLTAAEKSQISISGELSREAFSNLIERFASDIETRFAATLED